MVNVMSRSDSQGGCRCVERETRRHCVLECELMQPFWESVWKFLKQQEIDQACDLAISCLDIPKDFMSYDRKTYTPMFSAVFVAIARK